MSDYYNILGVDKNATEDDIKKAFRKIAREAHPDKGGDTEKFQQIQAAYEVLGNPEKRREYDTPNNTTHHHHHFPFETFPFFGFGTKPGPQKRGNRQYTFNITLRDAYFGITKRFKIKRDVNCSCNVICNHCGGEGIVTHRLQNGPFLQMNTQNCNKCLGRGIVKESLKHCNECNNKGTKAEERLVELVLERGVESGKKFVIDGWGEQSSKKNDIPGDLVIEVIIESDPIFTRRGLDLLYTTTITLRESIIGKEIVIPHFDGDYNLHLKGFGIVNPNKQYIVFDKGMVKTGTVPQTGNLHLRFIIQYPDGNLEDSQITILLDAFDKVKMS